MKQLFLATLMLTALVDGGAGGDAEELPTTQEPQVNDVPATEEVVAEVETEQASADLAEAEQPAEAAE